jgi:pSer/pThr/pTyr-binding forkhead associated (FHA) protein
MWVLDWEQESISLHLPQGTWTFGRKGNMFNFPKDNSISREHAEIHVGGLTDLENVNELPSLTLLDTKSRFGTYVNDQKVIQGVPVPLKASDRISFGAKNTTLLVRHVKMVGCRLSIYVLYALDGLNYISQSNIGA